MSSPAEVFVYRESDAAPGTVEFLTVRHDASWGIPSVDEVEAISNERVRPVRQSGFYTVEASDELATEVARDHLWVCYDGLQGILEFKRNGAPTALTAVGARLGSMTNSCPAGTFHSAEWAVVVAKPDAFERGLTEAIETHLADSPLIKVAATEPRTLDDAAIEELWVPPYKWEQPQAANDWWYATVDYMKSGPSAAYLLTGPHASETVKAIKTAVRQAYEGNPHQNDSRPVHERVRSLLHGSDRTEELVRNAALFWEPSILRSLIVAAKQRAV